MKGRDWVQFLSDIEHERFKRNIELLTSHTYEECMEMECNSFYIFISGFFLWGDTPEGYNYWANISHRKINLTHKNYTLSKFRFV